MKILITRPEHQAKNLIGLANKMGFLTEHIPFYTIENIDLNPENVKQTLAQSPLWIASSANAIKPLKPILIDAYHSQKIKPICAAVGESTAKIWQALFNIALDHIIYPKTENGAQALCQLPEFTLKLNENINKPILLLQGEKALPYLQHYINHQTDCLCTLETYRRVPMIAENWHEVLPQLSAALITSGTALQNMIAQTAVEQIEYLQALPLIVPSRRVGQIADKFGFLRYDIVKESFSDASILAALQGFFAAKKP